MLSDLCARYLRSIRIDDVMTHLARITEHDRYQASLGIEKAAELIATAARAIGLQDVTIERFTADGSTPWWTFQAPRAWTPTTAQLEIRAGDRTVLAVDHMTQPFTIATYSAPMASTTHVARFTDDVRGALVVIAPADFARPTLVADLVARGALGFVTDGPSRHGLPGRIELASDASLFAFSVTTAQREAIEAALSGVSGMSGMHDLQIASSQIASRISSSTPEGSVSGAVEARIHVAIDRTARMPVVTGVLPGSSGDEVWLTSHLCHPRPGANDNASGSAGLLGVAAALVTEGRDFERSIRFVWGPEFVGVAALLHQRYGARGRDARPIAVINLDMIGEDPVQCGVPLVVERPPDWCPSLLAPLAEHVAEQVFAQTSADPGAWRPGPFYGFSDHALFANFSDPDWRSPAVQLWHPGDPFNHSAADTLDKVSPVQMRRAIAIGAVLADVLARDVPRDVLAQVVDEWCARETAFATTIADRHAGAWSDRFLAYTSERTASMRALVANGVSAHMEPWRRAAAFSARWPGPFNYRGLLAALTVAQRDDVMALFLADKRNYAVLTHFAMLAETSGSRDEAIEAASFALRAPIDAAAAQRLWTALFEAGWLAERAR